MSDDRSAENMWRKVQRNIIGLGMKPQRRLDEWRKVDDKVFTVGDKVRMLSPTANPSTEYVITGFPISEGVIRIQRLEEGKRVGEPFGVPAGAIERVTYEQDWPDTLPWGEDEQQYYRTASDEGEVDSIIRVVEHTRAHDGGTFDPRTLEPFKGDDGQYQVALPKEVVERTIGEEAVSNGQLADEIREYLAEFSDILSRPNHFLGTWISDGKIYLDVSTIVSDRDQAKAMGRQWQQESIMDWGKYNTGDWDGAFFSPDEE